MNFSPQFVQEQERLTCRFCIAEVDETTIIAEFTRRWSLMKSCWWLQIM